MIWKKDIKRLRQEQQVEYGKVYTRIYAAPQGTTLASLKISKGDTLPTEAGIPYAEIIDVQLSAVQEAPGKVMVAVKAFLADLWEGVSRADEVRELSKSRILETSTHGVRITCNFELDKANLFEGTMGWDGTGIPTSGVELPIMGEDYPHGTWQITPTAEQMQVDYNYSDAKARVVVVYTAYRRTEASGDIQRLRAEQQTEDGVVYTRVYPDITGTTVPQLGDILTSPTNAEVIEVQIAPLQDSPATLAATIKAFKPDLWAGVSPAATARELAHSRIMQKTGDQITLVRRYEVTDTDLSEGSLGWTATGLPAMGDAYSTGTWNIKPKVSKIDLDRKYTPSKTLVTVTYTGYLAWGDVTR
jgi:hypothetical protein